MSVHSWALENLESYIADGLDSEEREELEQHLAECSECTEALDQVRTVDRELRGLFAPVRPNPTLEDRICRALRQPAPGGGVRRLPRLAKVGLGLAAAVFLAAVGASFSATMEWMEQGESRLQTIDVHDATGSMPAMDGGGDIRGDEFSIAQNNFASNNLTAIPTEESKPALGEVRSPAQMAEEFREKSYLSLRSSSQPGTIYYTPGPRASEAPLAWTDVDPAAVEPRMALPGILRSDEAVGLKAEKKTEYYPSATALIIQGGSKTAYKIGGGTLRGKVKMIEGGQSAATSPEFFKPGDFFASKAPDMQDQGKAGDQPVGGSFYGRSGATKEKSLQPAKDAQLYFKPGDVWDHLSESRKEQSKVLLEPPAPDRLFRRESKEAFAERMAQAKRQPEEKKEEKPAPPAPPAAEPATQEPPAPVQRKIIRSGEVEFEVDSFDAAVTIISRLVANIRGAFVATVNSDKLANGKMRGSVVVRIPPEQLDVFLLEIRKDLGKFGELKGQRIGSQDVTKQYIDLESRLRGARTMEERLLRIIKDGKGDIKDLLTAEKQLNVTRTTIEELEGELRYVGNLVSLSTLTVNLTEKEIRAAALVTENECVQTGIEVEDVDKARRTALDAVHEAKGRVTRDEMKQLPAGQYNAILHFEVEPAAAGTLRDTLRQLGNMVRLEVNRAQHAEGGALTPKDGKLQRGPTQFQVSIYNLANVAPCETQTLKIAATDVSATFAKLREAVAKTHGRVVNAKLNEQDRRNINGQLDFDVRRADLGVVLTALGEAGQMLQRLVTRVPEGDNVTDAKVLFTVELVPATAVPPREVVTLAEEVADVDQALAVMTAQVRDVQGHIVLGPQRGQERDGQVVARVIFDVPLAAADGVVEKFKGVGQVRLSKVQPNPQGPEGRLAIARIDVTVSNAELLVPGEQGLGARVRSGLSFSLRALSFSVGWLIVGLLVVLPWVLLIYGAVWLTRRFFRRSRPAGGSGTSAT